VLRGLPAPVPDLDTQPFWDGCRVDRFLVPECASCGARRWPPGPMCPVCQSTETRWIESSGRGTVYSWLVVHHPVNPVLVDQVPYVVAMIDLEEGVRVVGNVEACDPDAVSAGMPVAVFFEDHEDGMRIPNFRPAG
jgi:uncharacterized OB-fold protein